MQSLHLAHIDTAWVVAKAPQILQAVFAAVTDVFVYKLALLQFGQTSAWYVRMNSAFSTEGTPGKTNRHR